MNAPKDVTGRLAEGLRVVADLEPEGASTTEVAARTGLPRPTVHRLLSGLAAEGFLDRSSSTRRWVLGPELYLLGRRAAARYDLSEVAQPFVQALARRTGESAFFSTRRGDETVCLVREDGSFPIRSHVLHEGVRFPLGVASAGIAILAYLPEREIADYFARNAPSDDFGPAHESEQIQFRLAQTRERGWALNPGLIVPGSWGMAAAVFDSTGHPRWALSLTGIEQRFTAKRQDEYGRQLLEAAHAMTRGIAQRGV